MEVKSFNTTHLSDYCRGTNVSRRLRLQTYNFITAAGRDVETDITYIDMVMEAIN